MNKLEHLPVPQNETLESSSKPVFTVLLKDDDDLFETFIRLDLEDHYDLRFIYFTRASELPRLAEDQAFDLVCFYLSSIEWDVGYGNMCNLIPLTDGPRSDSRGTAVEFLGNLRTRYGKPILVTQGMDLVDHFNSVGVTFITAPYSLDEFKQALAKCLPPTHNQKL